jgi:hypothetical protein
MGRLITPDARTLGVALAPVRRRTPWLVFSGIVVLFVLAGRGCG